MVQERVWATRQKAADRLKNTGDRANEGDAEQVWRDVAVHRHKITQK